MTKYLPKVDMNYFTERKGVLAVQRLVNRMQCIWRETPNKDVGIDGQIEYVDSEGNTTGNLVAVQVKSGKSYLSDDQQLIRFNPSSKHRSYWENFPLPVIVVIYDPKKDMGYWVDVRRILRSDRKSGPIEIPRSQVLEPNQKDRLFESCGALGLPIMNEKDVLSHLIKTNSGNISFPLSYFDIFSNGLTDIGRKVFFSMGLCLDLAGYKLGKKGLPIGVSLGEPEYDFVHNYIKFLVSQSLIIFDYSDYLIDFYDRRMVPTFLVPLTSRGRKVCDLARELGSTGNPLEFTECYVGIERYQYWQDRLEANNEVFIKLSRIFSGIK